MINDYKENNMKKYYQKINSYDYITFSENFYKNCVTFFL